MEPHGRQRPKKLIWAVEAVSGDSRLSCDECNERLRRERGCKRPDLEPMQGQRVYHASSPLLVDGPHWRLSECPVGMLAREAPWVWDVLAAQHYAEHAGFEALQQSRFLQDAMRLVASERGRHMEERQKRDRSRSDAAHASRVLKG